MGERLFFVLVKDGSKSRFVGAYDDRKSAVDIAKAMLFHYANVKEVAVALVGEQSTGFVFFEKEIKGGLNG